jgi:hypothetical protein
VARAEVEEQLRRLRAAVEQLAAEDVDELIRGARQDARERARAHLAEAMTASMLDQVERRLTPPSRQSERRRRAAPLAQADEPARPPLPPQPATERAPQRDDATPTAGRGLYVYCVVPADTQLPDDVTGVDPGGSPTLLAHDDLAAVISYVPLAEFEEERLREHLADMAWVERTARAHEHVLETVARVSTLIPMRMCSIYRSEDGVREMLAHEADALSAALEHLRGRAEWGAKVFAEYPSPAHAQAADGEAAEEPPSGTDYMRQRQSERDARWSVDEELHEASAAIHERLSEIAVDAITLPLQRPEVSGHEGPMLSNGVYLLGSEQEQAFLALVEQLRDEYAPLGLVIEPTGPWPAYNFVPGAIGAAW